MQTLLYIVFPNKEMMLNSSTFFQYALSNYNNPQCTDIEEFDEDLKRFQYVKRLLAKYKENLNIEDLRTQLILNHIIVILNVFGIKAGVRMMFFKLEGYYDILIPFLLYLNALPERIDFINNTNIIVHNIPINKTVNEEILRIYEDCKN